MGMQVPEEKNTDGKWVPKGTKPALQLSHQQVRITVTLDYVGSHHGGRPCAASLDCLFLMMAYVGRSAIAAVCTSLSIRFCWSAG